MSKETKPEGVKLPGRVKHRQALNDYLALGPDRSIEKLHVWYIENAPKAPCLRSLKGWSARYDWQARSAEHDERVAGGVKEKVEDAAVEGNWDRVADLTELAQRALKKAINALKDENMVAKDPYAVAALTNIVLGAIKGVELLSGRATGRFETLFPKDQMPEWMAERLKDPAPAAAASDEIDIPETATQH